MAECFLAVNANYENPRRDFLDTVIIARGTQNPLRVAVKYNLNDLEWTQFDVTEGISQNDKFKTVQKYIVEHNHGKVRYTIRLMSVPTRVESADSPVREYTFVEEVSESRDIYRELDELSLLP